MTVNRCIILLLILSVLQSFLPAFAQGERIVIPDSLKNRPINHPRIVFEEREHDFGRFSAKEDTLKTHTFVFKNEGNKDLVVLHAVSGCGCTKPIYTKQPVRPGEKGELTVAYRGEGQRPGFFRKSVTVYTNDPRSYVRVFIKGELVE